MEAATVVAAMLSDDYRPLPTVTLRQVAGGSWDVVVVGGGPAGAIAARELARRSARVLLIDKVAFPRWKVCGSCLNGRSLHVLETLGLGHIPARHNAPALRSVRLMSRGQHATIALPEGRALSRRRLDFELVQVAIEAGATFLPNTRAHWVGTEQSYVRIELASGEQHCDVTARAVIAADGLTAGFSRHVPGVRIRAARDARIGAGATLPMAVRGYAAGCIHMAIGSRGYVGFVRLEDGQLDVAAALDPHTVREAGGLANAVARIVSACGLPGVDELRGARWYGTPPLTRRITPPNTDRLLQVGDAARYVEPFTGEGMAWALTTGAAVVPFALRAMEDRAAGVQRSWCSHYRDLLGGSQWRCRLLTLGLRRPVLTTAGLRLLSFLPQLAGPYVRSLNGRARGQTPAMQARS